MNIPPQSPSTPDVGRPRITGLFLGIALVLALSVALLTFGLVSSAVEERIQVEIGRTAHLIGGPGFPLGDESVGQMARYLGAEIVVVDPAGGVVAASLGDAPRQQFAQAWRAGTLPVGEGESVLRRGQLGGEPLLFGVAPLPPGPPRPHGTLYVLYSEDLIAAQRRGVWLPVSLVAVLATLIAAVLGMLSERALLRARTRALLGLLASVAHELQNPLGAIQSLARSLKGQGEPNEPLELIAVEAERLGLLVEGLRAVGRPAPPVREMLAPDAAVKRVVNLLSHQLSHRRITLCCQLNAPEVRVSADPTQMSQVLLNLLQNAADAMPRGGEVRVLSEREGEGAHASWRLVVEDQGTGVPVALRPTLFEPFVTTKPKGLGVGLYLSRRLVEDHGGRLQLDASYLEGARFVLSWPVSDEASRRAG